MNHALDLAVTAAEIDLEKRIDHATLSMLTAKTPEARRRWFEAMRHYIRQRGADQVARMEDAAGLSLVFSGECDSER